MLSKDNRHRSSEGMLPESSISVAPVSDAVEQLPFPDSPALPDGFQISQYDFPPPVTFIGSDLLTGTDSQIAESAPLQTTDAIKISDVPTSSTTSVTADTHNAGDVTNVFKPVEVPNVPQMTEPLLQLVLTKTGEGVKGNELAELNAQDASQALKRSQSSNNFPQRAPLVIPGSGKGVAKAGNLGVRGRPSTRRRVVVNMAVMVLLAFIMVGTLMAVVPAGQDGHAMGGLRGFLNPLMSLVSSKDNNTTSIIAQAATATAVTQDGYDPGNKVYAGVIAAPANNYTGNASNATTASNTSNVSASDAGSLNRFFYGQCTYWANMRYHELTGHWVPWLGNAYQWAYNAPAYGWTVSDTPNPAGPSIIVLGINVQTSGSYGHVAVVERVNGDGTVYTSNWNWLGGWAQTTYVTFKIGPGVKFVWYPG